MSRKILKIIISLLFLAVAAVAAVLGIKSFFPELFEEIKYGLKHIIEEPARKTPAFKKDKQEQEKNNEEPRPVYRQIPDDMTDKYGVAPVRPIKPVPYQDAIETKYGVAPVRLIKPIPVYDDNTEKYGVAHIQKLEEENLLKNQIRNVNEYGVVSVPSYPEVSKYGVAPIERETEGDFPEETVIR